MCENFHSLSCKSICPDPRTGPVQVLSESAITSEFSSTPRAVVSDLRQTALWWRISSLASTCSRSVWRTPWVVHRWRVKTANTWGDKLRHTLYANRNKILSITKKNEQLFLEMVSIALTFDFCDQTIRIETMMELVLLLTENITRQRM